MPTPLARYQRDLQRPDFVSDEAQKRAVQHTQQLYEALIHANTPPTDSLLSVLRAKLSKRKKEPVKGLYFWGGVGRGKTYLIDNFYDCLPFSEKMRIHFHRFMRQVHEDLQKFKALQNPLTHVARHLAQQTQVLCLDEFHVADITDAMLLTGLLKALFDNGVTLVSTSNVAPDLLYKGGLQRDRFLPAIALLKQYTQVLNVDGGVDYRLRTLEQAEIYHYPLDAQADINMLNSFMALSPEEGFNNQALEINGRSIQTKRCADGIVWFDFEVLCNVPRAVSDYIEIAQCFNTVFLSNIPVLDVYKDDHALRLINLVDEFYDRNVKLIVSAATSVDKLYTGQRQAFQFQRTISRLLEMQSHDYLQRPHLP
ncbi:cell division protein ZapE [Beggiatoa leptomitoformis]|uniref:Cell division protein ZapE n=1 Tax=Beggiatoa leptomitoformis TaxID=288004 RepID=A0A2N9YES1_9GAMM|nr:cell division protein ZapE [Beggiatoa leptomitoformis]ALG68729.1 cell division protein ZapE [Beggiatoa leptomitoformis]AUI68915.1 cell division protein ZapE [Beggiatoa leptomitoformis]